MSHDLDRYRAAEQRVWASAGLKPLERRVELRSGGMIRAQEVGHGPPLVLVHGVSIAGASWATLMARLEGFRCIALDRPGCGLSDPIVGGPLSGVAELEQFADTFIADALDALELPNAHVLATSFGSYFAVRGAAAHPGRVDRMVLYSWSMGAPMDKAPLGMRIGALPGMQSLATRMPVTKGMLKIMLRQVGMERAIDTGAFDDEALAWAHSLMRDTDTMRNEVRSASQNITVRGVNKRIIHTDELLSRVRAPVLMLWGDEDPNAGEATARGFAARFPNAELEMLRKAGHAPWFDQPELCARRTAEFLAT